MTPARSFARRIALLAGLTGLAAAPAAAQTISSAANQTFVVGDPSTTISAITITDAATPTITAKNNIRVRIPAALNMTWDATVTTATITGTGASKVSTTVSYTSGNKNLLIAVNTNFAGGDQIVISGLKFTSFTATSAATALQLVVSGNDGGATAATDDKTKTIVAPTLVGSANQFFTVGDPATAMTSVTITDASTPTITAANDLRIRIPSGFNMVWNTAITTATIGGGAAGKVSTTVSYENSGQVLVLNVTSNFAASDQITVSGLQFTNFTAPSAASSLQLVVSGAASGGTAATSTTTKTILAPISISSAANQSFNVGMGAHTISTITITGDASTQINTTNKIRVRIPSGFGMTWNTAVTTATIGGAAASKVSTTVSYENSGQVLVINVTTNFAPGDQITVAGLQFTNFTAVSAASSLQLVTAGSAGGATAATDDKTITVIAAYGISSAANQTFIVGDPSTTMSAITVTDSGTTPTITAKNDILIIIPAGLNMTWDPTVTTATITGSAASKVSTTVSFSGGNATLTLNVTTNFAAGDQIVVSGLKFTSFTAASGPASLQEKVGGGGGAVVSTDDKTKTIIAPTFTGSANQFFTVGDPATAMTSVTITDAATPTITAANDIRIRIPSGFNMVWNTAITTATIGGGAAGKVSTTVSYENSGQVLVLNVTSDFAASDQITVSGLQFTNFTAPSAASSLQLVVSGSAGGGTAATSTTTKTILAPISISSAANQIFNVGMGAHTISTITITGDASTQINTTNGLRIRIPSGFNMTWNTAITTATIGGGAASKVSTTVSYASGNQTLVINVTTNFAPGDQITVSGLQFNNFTAVSPANNLQLATGGAGGPAVATDDKTITVIAAYGISSASNQSFYVGEASTLASPITVTDSGTTPTITAKNDILIIIPAGLSMTWDNTVTTVTITGGAASKVSTTVSYPAANTLTLNVTTNFAAGDQIVVSGLKFTSFTAASGPSSLQEKVGGGGGAVVSTDDKTITITGSQVYAAAVSPHAASASQLPATNYTTTFTVQNTGNGTDSYDLLTAKRPGTALTTVSITGSGVTQGANPDSARLANLATNGSTSVTVTYSVSVVALGTIDSLVFRARSVGSSVKADSGKLAVTVLRPSLAISKDVNPSGTRNPGTDLTYTVTVTNGGSSNASSVVLVDSLSSTVQFKVGSVVNSLPVAVVVEYSNNAGSTWTYVPASGGCSAASGYDACVNRIRWTLQSSLSFSAPNNTGNVQFIAQIR